MGMGNRANKEIEMKNKRIPKRFFRDKRVEIFRVLISELEGWESADKPTNEEFFRLVDRLVSISTPPKIKNMKTENKEMFMGGKSEVNIRPEGKGFFIEIKDQYTKNCFAVTREELEKIVLYAQIILTP